MMLNTSNFLFVPTKRAPNNDADWCNRFAQNSHRQPIGDKNVHLFFEDSGYNVKQVLGLRCENAHDAIALVPDHQVMDMVRQVDADDIDAIIQVGTNLSTATSFPVIEKWLEKPVLPINVATAWHALRSCGVRDQYDHLGRLFEEH